MKAVIICALLWAAWTIQIQGQSSDRPNLIMLYRDYSTKCLAAGNTLGYGLALMKKNTSSSSPIPTFDYTDSNGESIDTTYNCDFENDETCSYWNENKDWRKQASNNLPLAPIIDERWDKFKIYATNGESRKNYKADHKYDKSYDLQSNFYIGISIRSNRNAQILLCGGTDPRSDKCYWIIIDGFDNFNETVIRKCIGGVPDQYPRNDPDCTDRKDQKIVKLLDASKWKHFLLTKEENQIRLWAWSANTPKVLLLDYNDDKNPLSPNRMYLRSYMSMVEWKVHEYNYLRFSTTRTQHNIYFPASVCLSLYVALCEKCTMILDIHIEGEPNPTVSANVTGDPEEQYFPWKNIRLQSGSSQSNLRYMLYVSLIVEGNRGFWAMDGIRTCSNNEIRRAIATDNEPLICHSLKYPDWTIDSNKEIQDNEPPVCEKNFNIGLNCNISCNSCQGNKICLATRTGSSEAACTCAPGYQWKKNHNCDTQCKSGSYGYRCEKKCGKCQYEFSCDRVTGTCGACEEGYLLPLCQQSLPYLVDAPKSVTVLYYGATVRLDNVAMKGDASLAGYIQLECRQDGYNTRASDGNWFICGKSEQNIKAGIEIEVTKLSKETKYQIRAVVLTSSGEAFRHNLPTEVIETSCKPLLENNTIIHPESRNATISFKIDDENCDITNYYISIDNNMKEKVRDNNTVIKELTPYRKHTLEITHQNMNIEPITTTFWTAEDAPGKVRQLRCSTTYNEFEVNWEEPEEKNGELRLYTVEYELMKRSTCPQHQKLKKLIKFNSESKTIKIDGDPYSNYTVTVFANTKFPGEKSSITCETLIDNSISEEEFPKSISLSSKTSVSAKFSFPFNCAKQRGPLFFDIFVKCVQNEWCDAVPILNRSSIEDDHVTISSLTPFTNYLVTLQGKRAKNESFAPIIRTTEFSTPADSPSDVRSFDVYSKGETYIAVRWMDPRPPHGRLKDYELKISARSIFISKENLEPCNLWTEQYFCHEFKSLHKGSEYTIQISANNKESEKRGPVAKISAVTRQDISSRPLNLLHNWEQDQLKLSWNHPNKTNGNLKKFLIVFIINSTEITNQDDKTSYNYTYPVAQSNMNYNFTIIEKFKYSSSYTVTVCGVNSMNGENATLYIDTPPEKPELAEEEGFTIEGATNTTVTIKISGAKNNTKSKTSYLYVVVRKIANNISKRETQEMQLPSDIFQYLRNNNSWIAIETEISDTYSKVRLGNGTRSLSVRFRVEVNNKELEPETEYEVIVIVMNQYRNKTSSTSYSKRVWTPKTEVLTSSGLWALLLLLLLPIAAFLIYKHVYKKKDRRASIMMMIPRLRIGRSEDPHEPDVIPLTEEAGEPERTRPKKPAVAPKPGPSKPAADSERREENKTDETNGTAEITTEGTNFFHSRIVLLENLEDYLKEALEDGELEKQHALFPRGQTKPWDYGMLKPNKLKNRYTNLIAYDHNRVKLEKIDNDQYSDYINASYIHGYKQENAYIATQGPKQATVNDFWRMVWQEKTQYIVMLANVIEGGKRKCEKYWPEINSSREYGDIEVYFEKSELYADFEYRTFVITYKKEKRLIYHLHFTSWPDHGVPLYPQSLVPFLKKMLTIPQSTAPVIVHCSAGVGRTGTIILCDICLRMAAREKAIDVLRYLHEIREQRANMVDNTDQYKLVHMVLLECLLAPDTNIPCNADLSQAIQKLIEEGGLQIQLNYLQQSAWQDKALNFVVQKQPNPANDSKNRVKDIVPTENQVYITRFPVNDENSDYINAVPVDGFRFKEQFIVTQLPMPDTVKDFWRMVSEKSVKVIVSLNDVPENDPTCCAFWPKENEEMKPTPKITLKHHKLQIYNYYDVHSIILDDKVSQESFTVQIVQFKGWKHENKLPQSEENLVLLWEETETLSHGNYPMIVTCYDGATASGLFVAMSFVIEKIKLEQQCDPCLAVRVIRRNRKQFVSNKVQFEFLYRSAVIYLSMFETYSNFQPVVSKTSN